MTVASYSTKSRVNASTSKERTSAASMTGTIDVAGSSIGVEKPLQQISGIIGEHISLRSSPPQSSSCGTPSLTHLKRKQTMTLVSSPPVIYGDRDFVDHNEDNTHSNIFGDNTGDHHHANHVGAASIHTLRNAPCRQTIISSINKLSTDMPPTNRLQNAVDTEVVFFNEQSKSKRLYRETTTLV